MVFTHFGLSGPAPMDVSRAVNQPAGPTKVELWCDFRPEMPAAALAEWLDHECQSGGKRLLSTALGQLLPNRLADALVAVAVPGGDCRAAEAGRDARRRLVQAVKQARVPLSGTLGLKKAEVTAGGVALAEVDSRSMQSKLVPGLFFAGELLDLDGPIGGFNFQAAFCTGHLAGTKL
jgi:predicted Rossmann fold flavoprotein